MPRVASYFFGAVLGIDGVAGGGGVVSEPLASNCANSAWSTRPSWLASSWSNCLARSLFFEACASALVIEPSLFLSIDPKSSLPLALAVLVPLADFALARAFVLGLLGSLTVALTLLLSWSTVAASLPGVAGMAGVAGEVPGEAGVAGVAGVVPLAPAVPVLALLPLVPALAPPVCAMVLPAAAPRVAMPAMAMSR